MKVYAVIEKDGMGNEKVIALYDNVDMAFERASNNTLRWIFKEPVRSVEAMKVIGAEHE